MRSSLLAFILGLFASAGICLAAADPSSALNAIKQLPRGEAKKIARIEAREGTPYPDRWYIIVNDPKDENGVHEYVVSGGEVVASRNISQFAESVKPTDVIGSSNVRVDSDKLADLVQQYAEANKVAIAKLNYSLYKEGADATPLWNVTCIDENGKEIGHIVVSAGKGNVISHDGFTAEPGGSAGIVETQNSSEPDGSDSRHQSHKNVAHESPSPQKKDVFSKIGNSLSKFFTGH
ncbi:hypothetical protein CfE428DRAFT_0080 [Chthoniobacter flavus Ellin428]|uniref:PepSY domain-containing protein n=1 Tax=Chthoniobacter flavus Ellin428 TaxID=497964 RepID=B4CTR7_9BACT|nr:hypothetical protein [Chthoniobacter flavus]EDY21955.1 hypothetical protein CfE428DRAFT_0080 [Chthoniobacter flavus Ellin428]TCO89343.1 hypothetical protein EV701_11477 [Chthoniobacter flavus]